MKRFDVVLINLDSTIGAEIKKDKIISPDVVNTHLKTIIVAPLTTKGFLYPTRVKVKFNENDGLVVLDQIRAVDKSRVIKILGSLKKREMVSKILDLFA